MASSLSLIFFPQLLLRLLQQSALLTLLCVTRHSCSNLMPLRYSDNKIDLKFMLFEDAQDVFFSFSAVCCMLYPTTLTDYPSTTRAKSVGPPVAVNNNFCG
jgi:hypothetical protein